jgi:hypothetical protein
MRDRAGLPQHHPWVFVDLVGELSTSPTPSALTSLTRRSLTAQRLKALSARVALWIKTQGRIKHLPASVPR